MKQQLTLLICLLALPALALIDPPGKLMGRWQQKWPGDLMATTIYRPDGTFDILLNGKLFVNGKYKLNGDTLAYDDPTCGNSYYGTYQLTFITPDSIRQVLIQDTCQARREVIGASPTNGRIKPTKP